MSDDLDGITLDQLAETFAAEVAELVKINTAQLPVVWRTKENTFVQASEVARFATSADAVLPFMQDCDVIITRVHSNNNWRVRVLTGTGEAPTFARAACIALIRAKRAQKA